MRKHGWQLPYHPLQVVAVAVFLSLGFAFYVFFAPFVGRKMIQFIAMGVYTILIATSFSLYIACAATDPADCAVFKSRKYLYDKALPTGSCEEGAFFCSLCEIEVKKYSKHCRVCDKCVDRFDHHCRWLNNCVGRRNYAKFFALMVSALILLILQWSTGILVLVLCFLDRKHYSSVVPSKLGSSFSLVPFVIVVGICTSLAMVATLPLAQLFFFHILLVKKGITTYDYIIALRDQDQEQRGQQSPQMSQISSLTGLSSASSFTAFHRAAWCTPPRLFLEDQFDVVPPETASVSSRGKKLKDEVKNVAPVKISPWALARLDPEQVAKAADEARRRSKILKPVDGEESVGSRGKRGGKRVRVPVEGFFGTSSSLVPLQLEARSAFQTSRAMSGSAKMISSSPESSLNSPDALPFRVSSFVAGDSNQLEGFPVAAAASPMEVEGPLSRSTSGGYEASGGEDSDRVPSRIVQRSTSWSDLFLRGEEDDGISRFLAAESSRFGL